MPLFEEAKSVSLESISPRHLERLLEISTRLSSTLHLDDLLDLVMDVATELTDTEAASILLVDRKSGQLHFVASKGGDVPPDMPVPLEGSIAGWVVQNGRSVVLADVQEDERFYANVDQNLDFQTRSMLAVPLNTQNGTIGALEVLNKRNGAEYTGQDVALMEALASQAAVAIVNAYLFNQSDLLAEVMHEIKTPLMAITTASELMQRAGLPEEQLRNLAQMIHKESFRLANMTRDFVDFARLESGRIRLAQEPVDIGEIIQEVVSLSSSQASARQITIDVALAGGLPDKHSPRQILGDADRLKQVLVNLVSNAIKYNRDNGRVIISASVGESELCVGVSDTGMGIAEEDLPRLFERFYRIPGSEKREGSGLGLTIAQKIVEAHNGRIEVQSTVGEGTTFTIVLPLHSSQDLTKR
jgi:signal transduction histidine kinase